MMELVETQIEALIRVQAKIRLVEFDRDALRDDVKRLENQLLEERVKNLPVYNANSNDD
jgi:hypothetical protein